jgi:hypothetical protein
LDGRLPRRGFRARWLSRQKEKADAEAVKIPFDQIWADLMPGTRDIDTLEPEVFSSEASRQPAEDQNRLARESMINKIAAKLQSAPMDKAGPVTIPIPRPAFAVLGTGRDALRAASDVFAEGQKPQQSFLVGSEISVVFFTYQAGSRVELVHVERGNNVIQIQYRFFDDWLTMTTSHLALIPLGQLPVGRYQVEIVQSPMDGRFLCQDECHVMADWGRRLVCQPFSFSVVRQGSK